MADDLHVIWSNQAIKQVDATVVFLEKNWTKKEISSFFDALENFETLASRYPLIYPESKDLKGYRRAIIFHHISIIYKIDKKYIRVMTVFDNRQDPNKINI